MLAHTGFYANAPVLADKHRKTSGEYVNKWTIEQKVLSIELMSCRNKKEK